MADLRTVVRIATRQLFSRRVNYLVGALLVVSSALLVVITTVRQEIEAATHRTMVEGFLGHLDIFSKDGPDDPSLYALEGPGELAAMNDMAAIRQRLMQIPNVASVSPVGALAVDYAGGNAFDALFARMRQAVKRERSGEAVGKAGDSLQDLEAQARYAAELLKKERQGQADIYDPAQFKEEMGWLERATSDAFWSDFDAHPLDGLEFLENRIAPLGNGEIQAQLSMGALRLENIPAAYNRVEVVDGTAIPPGKRGILLSKFVYEDKFKIKTARRLDLIKHAIAVEGRHIDGDSEMKRWVRDNQSGGAQELLLMLGPARARALAARLKKDLQSDETDPGKLITALLDTNDSNFFARYDLFYKDVAPLVDLYRVKLGEPLPLSAVTKTGYFRSVAVPLYGTYKFRGLDMAHPIVREISLTDLITFRELYGANNPAEQAEIAKLTHQEGATFLTAEQAEAAFAQGKSTSDDQIRITDLDPSQVLEDMDRAERQREIISATYPVSDFDDGAAVTAAVYLKDPSKADQTLREIRDTAKREHLPIRAVGWVKAAGYLGTFVFVAGLLLTIAVTIIFTLVAVMLNNTLMILTLQRVREIGTFRAVGASRGFVMALVLAESAVAAAVFGGIGMLAGSGVLAWLRKVGIPAPDPDSQFFFGGPALHPHPSASVYLITFGIVLAVCLIATLYPAQLALRVSPLTAMQTEE